METEQLSDLIKRYGEPLYQTYLTGFTLIERNNYSMPIECVVFKIPERPDFIIYSRYSENGGFHPNSGERYVIVKMFAELKETQKRLMFSNSAVDALLKKNKNMKKALEEIADNVGADAISLPESLYRDIKKAIKQK